MTRRLWPLGVLAALVLAGAGSLVSHAQPPAPPNIYRIKVEIEGTGTVSLDPAGTLSGGIYWYSSTGPINVTATATPASGWAFKEWQVSPSIPATNGTTSTTNPYTVSLSAAQPDWTVKAVFVPTYTITATAGPGGTISPSGAVTVPHGGSQTFTITPNTGYVVADVLVDGTSVGPVTSYTFTNVTANHTIHATFRSVFFVEDFEDITGWTRTGLWHIRGTHMCFTCERIAPKFAYYARSGACDYRTGLRTTGILTSPIIAITGPTVLLRFDYFRHVEPSRGAIAYDRAYVQVRTGTATRWGSWRTVWEKNSRHASPECDQAAITITVGTAVRLQVRFIFDSVDSRNNAFPGWAVDNVEVAPPGPTGPAAVQVMVLPEDTDGFETEPPSFTVYNYPNPVRDVHTTRFMVEGVEAEALRIEVYDLTGRLVYKSEVAGNELVWHTEDLSGLPLANGVYLYRAYVKVGGTWVVSDVQKLVILR